MPRHRSTFPNLDAPLLLTDGGLETTLLFHDGFDLPCFAAFILLDREDGRAALERYYRTYAELARERGYDVAELADVNRRAVEMLVALREALGPGQPPLAIGGSIGPRADGYRPGVLMTSDEAVELDEGDPADLARRLAALGERLDGLRVFGGCCGTDHRHVGAVADALSAR